MELKKIHQHIEYFVIDDIANLAGFVERSCGINHDQFNEMFISAVFHYYLDDFNFSGGRLKTFILDKLATLTLHYEKMQEREYRKARKEVRTK